MGPKYQLELLFSIVCKYYNVEEKRAKGLDRKRILVLARHMYVYIARQKTSFSLEVITDLINRDHSSGTHAVKVIENDYKFLNSRRKEFWDIVNQFENSQPCKIEVIDVDLLKITINRTKSFINSGI